MNNYQSPVAMLGEFSITEVEVLNKEKHEITTSISFKGIQLASFVYNQSVGVRFTKQHIKTDALQTLVESEYKRIKEYDKSNILPPVDAISNLEKFEVIATHLVLWDLLRQKYNEILGSGQAQGHYIVLLPFTEEDNFYMIETTQILDHLIGVNEFDADALPSLIEQKMQETTLEKPKLAGIAVLPIDFEFVFTWEQYFQFLE